MPPFLQHPIIFLTETIYFLIISIFCLLIYFKTRDIYELSKHKGIYYFRNIFLFFSMAYFVRLLHIPLFFGLLRIAHPRLLMPISMLLISYFSTMAILSIVMSLFAKKIDFKGINLVLHVFAVLSSVVVFLTWSHALMLLIQTILFLVSIIYLAIKGTHISQNKISYTMLFIFWILNIIIVMRRVFPCEYKIPLYFISVAVFFSIFYRVHKRLDNAKKR